MLSKFHVLNSLQRKFQQAICFGLIGNIYNPVHNDFSKYWMEHLKNFRQFASLFKQNKIYKKNSFLKIYFWVVEKWNDERESFSVNNRQVNFLFQSIRKSLFSVWWLQGRIDWDIENVMYIRETEIFARQMFQMSASYSRK